MMYSRSFKFNYCAQFTIALYPALRKNWQEGKVLILCIIR